MIDDPEMCALFRAESEEHLETLDHGLLRLETQPDDRATLEEVFRAAHSVKGSARMLGVASVEKIAHQLEDELSAARRGATALTPEVFDRFHHGLDAIRKLIREAVTGEPADIALQHALRQLRGEEPAAPADGH